MEFIMQTYFDQLDRVRYEGPKSANPLAFRHYNPDELVLGKRMEDHLRFAACYWHTFCWNGADMFGVGSFDRPWQQPGEALEMAKRKADVAFEFFHKLNVPYYCFHDVDVSPEGASLKEYANNFAQMVDVLAEKQQQSGVKLLWGTANCFTNPRYGAGAATNPDPEVFSWAATQVVTAMDATHNWAAKTMFCGAAAKAMKPCSIPTCARSASRLAALCSWWWSINIKSASRARC
jgi:xylose isomerase